MPTLLLSFKKISDSEILIHGTLAPNAGRAAKMMEDHAGICPKFGPARKAGETIEEEIDVDAIPEFDADAIGEWLDVEFGFDAGDDEEEDDDAADDDEELEEK